MTVLDLNATTAAPTPDGGGAPEPPPEAVIELSHRLAGDLSPDGHLDAAAANAAIVTIATDDVAAGCLAWRQVSNIVRLRTNPGLADVIADLVDGVVVASLFNPKIELTRLPGGDLRVLGRGMMTTGVRYAGWVLTEARVPDEDGSVLLAVPSTGIVRARRPELIGLTEADNTIVDIDVIVSADRVVGPGPALVGLPYDQGLTMGAVAVGAVEPLLAATEVRTDADRVELGELWARHAAVAALVEATPGHAPRAGWWSKAAKVAATDAGLATCVALRRLVGTAAYASGHPLNRTEADLRGLVGQAPAHAGAAAAVATAPTTTTNTQNKD